MTELQVILSIISGGIVGFTLGLLGGGGSILAVPLLLYVVGIHDAHVVIGSTALAVALNAFFNLFAHWHAGHVDWKAAVAFAFPGVAGAWVGADLGKSVNDKELLFLFAIVMMLIAVRMILPAKGLSTPHQHKPHTVTQGVEEGWLEAAAVQEVANGTTGVSVQSLRPNFVREIKKSEIPKSAEGAKISLWRVIPTGFAVGGLSGFFGIGGGFLIVPGLMFAARMSMIMAVGTSLFSVGMFGLTTAASYALSGLVNWWIVLEFVGGGAVGGLFGTWAATRLAGKKRALNTIFSVMVMGVSLYMLYINAQAMHWL
ncbi:sulfite exporter TauE/SafE family protein [Alicyclobacillaceae bacterium I2511]|nr:sulfite exporter TauE/SafE family protein [Alicyclobacillaceae bacterium I2511]